MAINKKLIHFGTKTNFEKELAAGNILDTSIIFIKDAKLIWTHGQYYGINDSTDLEKEIKEIEKIIEENELVIASALLNLDESKANKSEVYTKSEVDELAGNQIYTSNIEDTTLKMESAVGGIAKDTPVYKLNGKTFTELFDDLLFPTKNPNSVKPSVSGFTLNPTTTPVEIGSAVSSISAATLNKGYWSSYNNNLAYAGDVTSITYSIKINGTTYTDRTSLPSNYTTVGDQTYGVTIAYGKGPTPKNNKGVEVPEKAAAAGSVSASRSVNVTKPWFASTVEAGTYTKQSLISWNATAGNMSTGSFTLQPQGANVDISMRQTFIIPREAKTIKTLNTLSGNWEDSKAQWTKVADTTILSGTTYYKYYFTSSGSNGAQSVQVTF